MTKCATARMRRAVLIQLVMQLVFLPSCFESPSSISETKLKTIQIGMTRSEVKELIGGPVETDTYDSTEHGGEIVVWYYPQNDVASQAPRCVFDKESGRVVEVIASDRYRIP